MDTDQVYFQKNQKVLVIDDDKMILELIAQMLAKHHWIPITADSGSDGLALFQHETPTVVLLDIRMPDMDGIEILKQIKKISPIAQVVMISGAGTQENIINALRLGASDYLMKPLNMGILVHTINKCLERHDLIVNRIRQKEILAHEVKKRTAALSRTFYETIKALGRLTEKRDPYTAGHQQRVALLAVGIGRQLGMTDKEIEVVHVAALLHDIGKVAVPVELLSKPSRLTTPERSLMKIHPQAGYDIIRDIPFTESLGKDVAVIVKQHHERLDGSGYPRGLSGSQIEPEARILCISDVVEAMSFHRPYRPALKYDQTIDEITSGSGRIYSADCVKACMEMIAKCGNDPQQLFDYLFQTRQEIF